jgi:hypothetical protein
MFPLQRDPGRGGIVNFIADFLKQVNLGTGKEIASGKKTLKSNE